MRGKNPIRPPVKGDGSTLDIQHIFATIQGEGPYAGMPAVFVRLGGCNLACAFCDTEFESFRPMKVDEIMDRVGELALDSSPLRGEVRWGAAVAPAVQQSPHPNPPPQGEGIKLIILTGGEPFRQPIAPLCEALLTSGYKVQIETNGTLWRDLPEGAEIVCSPKNTGTGYFPLRPDLLQRVDAFKFIVSAHHPGYGDVADVGQGSKPVFVQPMDEYDEDMNKENLALAMELATRHGYRLSLQLHKIIGVE